MCNEELLKKHVRKACYLAGFSEATIDYIFNLIEVNMRHSYFREPSGIFQTKTGFSMGDASASRGSEVILRSSELDTYEKLFLERLLDIIKRYFRFKDDVNAHLAWERKKLLRTIEILSTTYPKEIHLNNILNIIKCKFLNLIIYNKPSESKPYTTILRKKHCRYDVIPPTSNTKPSYKTCAGQTYFNMVSTHCSSSREKVRQRDIVRLILREKGFSSRQIQNMKKKCSRRSTGPKHQDKLFIGTTTFDKVSNMDKYIRSIFVNSVSGDDSRFSLPMRVPGKKILQYIFTVKKMRRLLQF
jgi:hypothetical protein